jgi:transcriptional regulator with XRE-family HTH domain
MAKRKKPSELEAREYFAKIDGPMTLGRAMRAMRTTRDLTQTACAKKLGVSVQHLSDVENGRRVVSADRASRWARALGFPESPFVELALQAELDSAGIKLRVRVEAA